MKPIDVVYRLLLAVAAITALSGLVQMFGARFMLGFLDADTAPAAVHFFSIVGMFMLLFGGLLLHALLSPSPDPLVLIWTGLQKLGAFVFVSLGVLNGIFSVLALGVALFDLASGLLLFWYWKQTRDRTASPTQLATGA